MKFIKNGLVFLILSVLIISCKKDQPVPYPTVEFIKPYQNQSFNYNDTIQFFITVSAEDLIETAKLTLTDANQQPVGPSVIWHPEAHSADLKGEYPLSELTISGGNYTLLLEVTTETHSKKYFRTVSIAALQREFLGILLVTKKSSSYYEVLLSTNGSSATAVFGFSGDYGASLVNSASGLFLKYGEFISDAVAYTAPGWQTQWDIPASANPPFPFFTGLYAEGTHQYVAYYDGTSRGYDLSGTHFFSATSTSGYYPRLMLRHDPYFISVDYSKSGSDRMLSLFDYSSRILQNICPLQETPLALFPRTSDEIFLFGNKNGNAHLTLYHISNNGQSVPYNMPAVPLRDVARIDAENYLLLFPNSIQWYDWGSTSLVPFETYDGYRLQYEDISKKAVLAGGKTVYVFSFPDGALAANFSVQDTIVGMHLLYNQ